MGAFFTNVQVLIGSLSQEAAQRELINTIKEFICAGDFAETSNPAEADRSLFIVTPINSRWMTIFDEANDSLIELAIIASKVAGKTAIAIQVYHSDYCEFKLCRNGEQIDAFNSDLDYWGGYISDEQREEYGGKPEIWQDLIVDGKTPADLRAAWDSEPLVAEDIVYEMSSVLALDSFLARHSYRYFSQELKEENEEEFKDFQISRLIFRSKDRDNKDAPQYAAPKLALSSLGYELKLRLDQPGNIRLSVNNQGGPLKGLKVYTWGDAFDKDLVRLGDDAQVQIFRGDQLSSNNIQIYQQKWTKERKNDRDLNVTAIADFECPAMAFNKDRLDRLSRFHIDVPVTPLKLGQSEINLVAVPVENPKDGQIGYRIKIKVEPPPTLTYKPLPAEPVYEHQYQTIQRLEVPKFLLAMVSMNLDRKNAFQIATGAIARRHQVVAKYADKEYLCHYSVGRDKKLKRLKLPTEDIPNGKNWQTLCDQIEICEAIDGVSPAAANYNDANCGFGFDANNRSFQLPTPDGKYVDIDNDAVVPHLVLWVKIENCDADEIEYLTGQLTEIIDKVVRETDAWQAFLAKWSWQPIGTSLKITLYEQSCSLHGQITTGRNWCRRFLRAASERIWLSAELRKYLEDETRLAELCERELVGQALRLSLKPCVKLNRLEEVLRPLLPSEQDWLTAKQNRPRRRLQADEPEK
jgi:hypothetical protein